jgi:hypothetical protein
VLTKTPITSEATVLASLVTWSEGCPDWQRDALRRLCTTGALDDADRTELLTICKGDLPGASLASAHVKTAGAGTAVTLRQLHGVEHVNALAPDERLTFGKVGLTIVYGDNGSGKSGYARVLKKMCRARVSGRAEDILPNIYDATPGAPAATIDFSVDGQNASAKWILGQPADPALAAVSVFDSKTASTSSQRF